MAKPSIAISIDESRQRIQLEIGYLSNSRISSFWTKSFWTQNLFGPKKFRTQFFYPKFIGSKIPLDQKYFLDLIFLDPKLFWSQFFF